MSRIGIKPVIMPDSVNLNTESDLMKFNGPKGELTIQLPKGVKVTVSDKTLNVERATDSQEHRALHGTFRSLIQNAVTGVAEGFTKKLELVGIGYRASIDQNDLVLLVGFTHPVNMTIPEGIEAKVEKNVISLSGRDKQKIGQFAAEIRQVRKPEPYKGKGIRYQGELVRMKQGKAAKSGA